MASRAPQRAILLVALASCGRVGFDATVDAASPISDACTLGSFGVPQQLASVNSPSTDWGPWLSEDRLELLFGSDRSGTIGIYSASRTSSTSAFDAPILRPDLPLGCDDPFQSGDGLSIWCEGPSATMGTDLYVMTRPDRAAAFGPPQRVDDLSSSADDDSLEFSGDGLHALFASSRAGTIGSLDLFEARRVTTTAGWNTPVRLATLATPVLDCCPSATDDASMLLFSSGAFPSLKVYQTMRIGDVFQPPELFMPTMLGSDGSEADAYITRDGKTIVFSSTRSGGLGGFDLYLIERACL
ncbi:MAG: PD40 domain-containing protein [Myxococcales bacterium]|nr:PD40 domain-containing protein [Myxococcales bacterium]